MAARVRAVVWSESAQNALDEVIEYIAKDSRPAAVQVVDAALEADAETAHLVDADVRSPADLPSVDDILAVLVETPHPTEERHRPSSQPKAWFERPSRTGINYLATEAANASLGSAGEEFASRFEVARLIAAGRESLASKVERVSLTRGEVAGFDILSFEADGRERLIEVKTTRYGRHTPFFVSRNEIRTSDLHHSQHAVYRLFQFRTSPGLYVLPGPVRATCSIEPTVFEARPK